MTARRPATLPDPETNFFLSEQACQRARRVYSTIHRAFHPDMPKGPSLRLGLSHLTRQPSTSARRFLHKSPPCSSAVTLPLHDALSLPGVFNNSREASTSRKDPRDVLKDKLYADLLAVLSTARRSPSRVWGQYLDTLHIVNAKDIPLNVHQSVLRRCVPSTKQLRVSAALRLQAGNDPSTPHQYEMRLQTVVRNIKAAGWEPSLDDFHFILDQFAAVGHHIGAFQVYTELAASAVELSPKTYGLMLQALAHRLVLPCPRWRRPHFVQETTKICRDILAEMQNRKVPMSSVNLDLAIRVLKETADEDGFSHLMRVGYGIDLNFPDHAPVEQLERQEKASANKELLGRGWTNPQPFSTATLNTTIDMLGRFGNISKLVQTFEVLTQPLPGQASQHFSRSFDEEEEDFGEPSPVATQLSQIPHASPNTTSYNLLLKHVSRIGHVHLARHYLQQAYSLDRQTDRMIRSQMTHLPDNEVLAPHFAVNKGTLLPVFGLANRGKDMELMKWVGWVVRQTLRRKMNDIIYYSAIADALPPRQSVADDSQPLISSSSGSRSQVLKKPKENPAAAVFNVNLDAPWVPTPPPKKVFDIHFHIQLLRRDHEQISSFIRHVSDITSRTAQRIKERLGRRVWAGKDIFLHSDGQRQIVSRPTWTNIVRYKRLSNPENRDAGLRSRTQDTSRLRLDSTSRRRSLSTSAHVGRTTLRRRIS